jgi:fatty acid desaturase
MHDCVHDASFEKRKLNGFAGWIWGTFCFLPYGSWRRLHLEHHRWTGNVERDPSMKLLIEYRDRGYNFRKQLPVFWRTWVPGLALEQHFVFWSATVGKRESLFVAAALVYLVGTAFLIGPAALGLGIILYLAMVEVINFPHHLDLIQHSGEAQFKTYEQTAFTRSCHYPRWFAHLVLCNFNLHNEHHLFPAHPWYQLDKINVDLKRESPILNESNRNDWIVKNRRRDLEEVFAKTFEKSKASEVSDKREIRVA